MQYRFLFSLIFILFILAFEQGCRSRKDVPNILIILTDQWRYQAAGYAGDPNVRTPHLDQLAAGSANFKNAVSGLPVCTPNKASLLTGQRPLTNGVFMNDVLLDTNAVTLAKVLAKNNYQTAFIGKWHLDGQYRLSYTPPGNRRQGFQYWKAVNCDHDYNHSLYYDNNDTSRHYWQGYDVIAETQDAKKYIHEHANGQKPFFLMLSLGAPHNPYNTAPEKYRRMYDSSKLVLLPNVPDNMRLKAGSALAGYYAHISAIDEMVGELLAELKQSNILDNTIILFTSDHGDLLGSHGYFRKQQPYNESIKVPMLFYYHGTDSIISGRYASMFNTEDIMPTLLGVAGIKIPSSVEGTSFSGYMQGRFDQPKDTVALITCVQPFGEWARGNGGKEYRGVCTPNYTYARDLKGPWLLFDNKNDPYQLNNLIGNPLYASLQAHFDTLLNKELKQTKDEFLPGPVYVSRFHYPDLDSTGTVPYFLK
ncbi:sulfatase [Parafilimonas sp.]|uniref:sulfatase family protein n=1 Tax=Parafilimonas sp. TaxID=1969739 RepID=UPI0039E2A61B